MGALASLLNPRYFDLNGVVIAIESNTDNIASMMRARPFGAELEPNGLIHPHIVFRIIEGQTSPVPAKRGSFRNDEIQFVVHDKYFVLSYLRRDPWRVEIVSYDYGSEDLFFCVFDPLLFTYLMRMGQILWHCSGVTANGRSFLVPADAGGGKSTTALSLVSGGFDFLADDNIFLILQNDRVSQNGRVSAASSDRELFLRKPSVERLSALDIVRRAEWTIRGDEEKKRIEMLIPGTPRDPGPWPVEMVLFPVIGNRPETLLHALSPSEALMMCLGLGLAAKNPIAVFRDRLASDKQLEIYKTLATASRCYRIILGSDPEGVADAVKRELSFS